MRNWLKYILFVLLLIVWVVPAIAQEPPLFTSIYWVQGQVNLPDGNPDDISVSDRTVVFYKTWTGEHVSDIVGTGGLSGRAGEYMINIFSNGALPIDPGQTYYVAVENDPDDNYGAYPVEVTITGNGYETVDLTLALGGGPGVEEPPVELGTFWIDRVGDGVGDNIKIGWDPDIYKDPTIYAMIGNGTGQYSNLLSAGWMEIFRGGKLNPEGVSGLSLGTVDIDPTDGFLILKGHVGQEAPEAYFKIFSTVPADDAAFANAPAIGKVNVTLQGEAANPGKNLISYPFIAASMKIKDILGDGNDAQWQEGDMVQYKFAPSPAYLSAVYTADKLWKDAANTANEPAFDVDYRFGNWAIVKGQREITFVGNVLADNSTVAVYNGAGLTTGGKTMLGMVYPVALTLTDTSLITDGAQDGDLIQYKASALNQVYISAVVKEGAWKNAANTANPLDGNISLLVLPNSYLFVKYGDTGFDWNRVKP